MHTHTESVSGLCCCEGHGVPGPSVATLLRLDAASQKHAVPAAIAPVRATASRSKSIKPYASPAPPHTLHHHHCLAAEAV